MHPAVYCFTKTLFFLLLPPPIPLHKLELLSTTYILISIFIGLIKENPENVREPARLRQEMSALQKERDELPEFFLASYRRMIQGLDEMLALIKGNVK